MKRLLLVFMGVIPFMLSAQNKCVFFEKMVTLQPEKTDLNTTQSDFGPAFVGNELWFSAYTNEEIEKLNSGDTKKIYYNLFSVNSDAKGNITSSVKTPELVDLSDGYHTGPVAYCPATGELFVTLSNFENPEVRNKVYQKAEIRLQVIIAKKQGNVWTKVGELPYNDPTYSVGHPTVTSTGDTLYFASDKSGGLGGTDIYMAVRKDGVWGDMVNLGDKINTAGNDMFPFIFRDRILIFASNGRGDGEDLDLYAAGLLGDRIMEPNALTNLNSDGDDFAFVIHPNEEVGYYSSNKTGGVGSDDIYKVIIEPQGSYDLELVVMDRKTMQPIPNAKITFAGVASILSDNIFKKELEKNQSYVVSTNIDGYMNDSKTISTVGKSFGVIRDTLWVEKVEVGQKFVMENIYYDFDKWDILPESAVELDKLVKVMQDNPGWKVELGSHTDCRGSDAYNMKLSQKRSDSAVAYIVRQGISADRIIAKGYGETELVNKCDDGIPCSEAEHRQNRRTEFKILEMN